mgnify:FL=1
MGGMPCDGHDIDRAANTRRRRTQLPQHMVEFMGIDEKSDSDDYEIAVDLVAGDFYYSPNLKDDGNRKGFALCVQHLTDYIASQMDEKKSHD